MSIAKSISIAAVAAGLASAVAVVITFRLVPKSSGGDASTDQLAAMQAELDAIKDQAAKQGVLLGHIVRAGAGVSSPNQAQPAAPAAPAAPAPLPLEPPQPPEATAEALATHFGDTFASQGADPAWSQAAEGTVSREVARRLPPGSAVQSVQCRKSMCQLRSFHSNMDMYEKFAEDALFDRQNGLWNAAVTTLVVEQSAAGVRSVSYIAREGHDLPALEANN